MVGQCQLQVVEVEVQADEYDANLWVEQGLVARGDFPVVVGLDIAAVGGVGAADKGDVLGAELLLDAAFADDEDLAFVLGELQDARDVY